MPKLKTTAQFIQDARKIHGDKYDYSMVEYVNNRIKIKIICPKHGCFNQDPSNHLAGKGCTGCKGESISAQRTKTTEQFIQQAKNVHGDKYDYSLVEYVKKDEKVKIICPKHGIFEQIANNHLRKRGCASCQDTTFHLEEESILYLIKFKKDFAEFWKIGITNKTVNERFSGEVSFMRDRREWHFDLGYDAYAIEKTVLKEFAKFRYMSMPLIPILKKGGHTECFVASLPYQKVIATVERLIERIKAN